MSIRGWESAIDAQERVSVQVEEILREKPGTVCLVGHGGVGTLLYCRLAQIAIDRRYDQSGGGGCYFTFDIEARQVLHGWRSLDQIDSQIG